MKIQKQKKKKFNLEYTVNLGMVKIKNSRAREIMNWNDEF